MPGRPILHRASYVWRGTRESGPSCSPDLPRNHRCHSPRMFDTRTASAKRPSSACRYPVTTPTVTFRFASPGPSFLDRPSTSTKEDWTSSVRSDANAAFICLRPSSWLLNRQFWRHLEQTPLRHSSVLFQNLALKPFPPARKSNPALVCLPPFRVSKISSCGRALSYRRGNAAWETL